MAQIAEIKARIALAISSGDDIGMMRAIKELNQYKSEIAKAEQDKIAKEEQELAGVRQSFEVAFYAKVVDVLRQLKFDCYQLKAKSIIITVDHAENDNGLLDVAGKVKVTGAAKLVVPTAKKRTVGASGLRTSSKGEYGITLDEIFQKFATDEDRSKLEAADNNSKKWVVKNEVKKRALKDGLLQPAK